MKKIKILLTILVLTFVLSAGSPALSAAKGINETPPAIVFTQGKENPFLISHNFVYDNGLLVPAGDPYTDSGIKVVIP